MIIDAHCHAWPRWPYPRAADAAPIETDRHGSIERLRAAMTDAGVSRALVVSANIGDPPIDDDSHVAAAADEDPDALSFVADIDSRWSPTYHDGRMAERVRALPEDATRIGVGHYLADRADGWWDSPDAEGLGRALAERGMLLSLHAPPPWHPAIGEWARRHPDVPVLLHHLGLVRDEDELAGLLSLADASSVFVKASGFAYVDPEGAGASFPTGIRVLRTVLETFGPNRVVWGSDFPVSPEYGIDYGRALVLVRDVAMGFGAQACEAVLGGTMAALWKRSTA